MRNAFLLFLLCAVFSISPFPSTITAQETDDLPTFKEDSCPFENTMLLMGQTIDCGYLYVPEDWDDPTSNTIKLAVAIFRSSNPQPDPIVYLEGGPGGSALKQMEDAFSIYFAPYAENRDFIVMDQRGTGYSEPFLGCEELNTLAIETLDEAPSPQDSLSRERAAYDACVNRLTTDQNAILSNYNSANSARDFEALRQALGYDTWNLYGISYGTRLGLTIMRDYPESVRSAVLDASYPMPEDLFASYAPKLRRSLDLLFEQCADDDGCAAAYPDLAGTFEQTLRRLNEEPQLVSVTSPLSEESYEVLMSDERLLEFMFQAFYQTDLIPTLPQIIADASQGNLDTVGLIYVILLESLSNISQGMNLAVQCAEEAPFHDQATIAAQSEAIPAAADLFASALDSSGEILSACQTWLTDFSANPIEDEAVTSDIPTLVTAGEFDPITPPESGQAVADNLPNSYFYTFAGTGHGATVTGCAQDIALEFLDTPTEAPDTTCMAEMALRFSLPDSAVELVPFEAPDFGIRGVYPDGWQEVITGTYARPPLGNVAITHMSAPDMGGMVLQLLIGQLGIDELPDVQSSYTSVNGYEWVMYEVAGTIQGVDLNIYMAEMMQDGNAYYVILQSPPNEAENLYETVFLPSLDGLEVVEGD